MNRIMNSMFSSYLTSSFKNDMICFEKKGLLTTGAYVIAAAPINASQNGSQMLSSHVALGQRFSSTPSPPLTAQNTTGCFLHSVADFDDTKLVYLVMRNLFIIFMLYCFSFVFLLSDQR